MNSLAAVRGRRRDPDRLPLPANAEPSTPRLAENVNMPATVWQSPDQEADAAEARRLRSLRCLD